MRTKVYQILSYTLLIACLCGRFVEASNNEYIELKRDSEDSDDDFCLQDNSPFAVPGFGNWQYVRITQRCKLDSRGFVDCESMRFMWSYIDPKEADSCKPKYDVLPGHLEDVNVGRRTLQRLLDSGLPVPPKYVKLCEAAETAKGKWLLGEKGNAWVGYLGFCLKTQDHLERIVLPLLTEAYLFYDGDFQQARTDYLAAQATSGINELGLAIDLVGIVLAIEMLSHLTKKLQGKRQQLSGNISS